MSADRLANSTKKFQAEALLWLNEMLKDGQGVFMTLGLDDNDDNVFEDSGGHAMAGEEACVF